MGSSIAIFGVTHIENSAAKTCLDVRRTVFEAAAREKRTKLDGAQEVASLLEGRYAKCEEVTLICDNLNTPTAGAFDEAFPPARARKLVRRIRFCYPSKPGSWLNIAENELSSWTRQCVSGRRFGALNKLKPELQGWCTDVNTTQRGVDWQRKVENARRKLKSLYPKICV